MHDPRLVRPGQRIADLQGDSDRVGHRQRAAARHTRLERFPLQQFEHQEADGVVRDLAVAARGPRDRRGADVIEGADVRMVKGGDRARLTFEALAQLRIGSQRGRQDLDRDAAIQPRVAGAVDFAHSTGAYRRDEFIRPEPEARR